MNCAYGIMMTQTKIPKDIINMIMEYVIVPNKKGIDLILARNVGNVRNNPPKIFMKIIKFNSKDYYYDLKNQLNNILYYPRLIDNNTKYMSIRKQINDMNINSLTKLRITNLTKKPDFYTTYSRKENSYTPNNDEFELTKRCDFNKRLTNIDATYKVFVDSVLNTDKTEIMKNNYLKNYNIDAYTQKQFSKVRNEITFYYNIKEYMENLNDEFKNGYDGQFNLDETYKVCSINSRRDGHIFKETDCLTPFDKFEIIKDTNKYFTIETYYNLNENKIKITEKVQKSDLWEVLMKLNKIQHYQHPNLEHFRNELLKIECFKLDMNKINKKYNLDIDMKHYKKVYGSKYAYITTDKEIEPLTLMFGAERWRKINPTAFNKFKNKYFK